MIRLLRIELRRMWRRRMPWILLLGITAAMLVAGVITFITHDSEMPDVGDVSAQIEEEVARCRSYTLDEWNAWNSGEMQDVDPGYEEYLIQFESAEAMADEECSPEYFVDGFVHEPRFCLVSLYEPDIAYRQGCPDLDAANTHSFETETFVVDGEEYRSPRPAPSGLVPSISALLFAIAAILGASFIGAEYKAGTIETTLLWEPRRMRVLVSKLGSVGLSAFVIHITLLGFLVLTMLPAAVWRGSTAGVDTEFWLGLLGVVLRGGIVAAAIAAIALSVSVLTRNTVGGVAVLLGYSAVSPMISLALLRSTRPLGLAENMTVFANGGEVGRFISGPYGYQTVYSHGPSGAAIVVAAYMAIAITIALVVFRRRDID